MDGCIATPLLSLFLSIFHIVGLLNCCFLNGVFIRAVTDIDSLKRIRGNLDVHTLTVNFYYFGYVVDEYVVFH